MYWILFIGIAVVSYLVQANLKRKFEKYSEVTVASGMTGAEVAQKMLRDNGIFDVRVQPHEGWLSDHYDPSCKTVNLSQDVYHSNSVAAAAVAAHECGHAVQHARGYAFLRLRSALVPAVQFSSSIMTWVILGGILLINVFPTLLLIGILLFALTTLFSFVTLPVEIDASRRATQWLQGAAITSHTQQPMAVDALRSAAYTYVVAALSSLATLVYYLSIYLSRRD
ncbi:MAG: zinc metallopeptidase [Prevotella sp.]|uniref:zinc metallopeptidase n=2 Tax=Prevotellaceae TaxID=171552 RepID=UPI002A90AF9B|nr:zinc metallopeptidase [Hallella sp.]MBS7400314.1 zinc metallopeptidase [Prevotella sp.]MCI7432923.1 zinc metallopeptidase [Prevotella sp.]MDY5926295.1 zinc metallopeptidase [Hallella sp.]MED9945527.1 zinc metallopeptidase [Hallella sp.]